jgi:hypothetical protein
MSSYEPCYSWNIFHSWQAGDRRHFLEGMYSLFAGVYSRQTYSVCEMRGGIAACVHWSPSVFLARLAVIDDEIRPAELHLLRLAPLAWLRTEQPSRFEKIPTCYGPVNLVVKLTDGGKTLDVRFTGTFHTRPDRVVLHAPPVPALEMIRVNGKEHPARQEMEIGL